MDDGLPARHRRGHDLHRGRDVPHRRLASATPRSSTSATASSAVPSVLLHRRRRQRAGRRGRRAAGRHRPRPGGARVQAPDRRPDPDRRRRPAVGARGALGPARALGRRPGGRARGRAGRRGSPSPTPRRGARTRRTCSARALAARACSVTFLAEPQAAALHYAAAERVEPGSTIAVYDLGGGTFDAAVVAQGRRPAGFSLLGRPGGPRAARRHRLRRGGVRARPRRACPRRSTGSTTPTRRCCRRWPRSGASAPRPRRR